MNSSDPEFPGEDFFHPGFTPASFSPRPEPPEKEASGQQQEKPPNVIPRRPVPPPRHSLAATPTEAVNAPAIGLGLDSGTKTWPRDGTLEGPETLATSGADREAEPEPSRSLGGSGDGMAPAKPIDEASSPSSAYGESGFISASPSPPSPPPPWPASPHIQRDYAFSQLHGDSQLLHSHPVSPISDSENFSSRNASRANSLAYRVSQRTMPRSADSSIGRRDAPLPPLPQESPPFPDSPGEAVPSAGVVGSSAPPHGHFAVVAQPSAQTVATSSGPRRQPSMETSSAERRASLKNDWPLGHHAAVAVSPSQSATRGQNQTLELPFQREDESPVHETPMSQRPPSPEFFTPQASIPQARFSAHQLPTPRRTSQQVFSPYVPSPQQQHPRFSQQRSSQHAVFVPEGASVQGPPSPPHTRISPQMPLHPLQQHPPLPAHHRAWAAGGSGETPFMQQYEDSSVFGRTTDTSALKEEEAYLGRGVAAGATGAVGETGQRRLSGQSRSGAASAHSLWGGFRASWLPEVLWCLVAVACLGIIGVLLSRYDGHALASWPLPITLNTLIAFLVSVCHAALLFPVLEGLGQLKWNWFARQDRSLADFQAYEDARRGPVGALRLAFVTKGRCLSLLATFIMLTSVVTSPLTQMIIEYPTRLVTGASQASEVQGESYPPTDTATAPGSVADLDVRQKQSIQLGIYNPVDMDLAPLPPNCGSKGCQAQTFSSLSVCSRTADVTSRLRVSDPIGASELDINLNLPGSTLVRNASLPNGVYLVGSADTYNLNMSTAAAARAGSSPQPWAGSLSFANQSDLTATAISNFFIIYTNCTRQPFPRVPPSSDSVGNYEDDDRDQELEAPVSFRAVEVLLHFCVGTYEVTVDKSSGGSGQNVPRTVRTSTSTAVLPPRDQRKPLMMLAAQAQADGAAAARNYSVDPESVRRLSAYMASTFSGVYSAAMGSAAVGYTGTGDAFGSGMFGGGARRRVGGEDEVVRNMTANVATSLTNTIRSLAATTTDTGQVETVVSVRWGWLAVLAVQVVLAAAFLAGVALQTSMTGVPVVKASGGLATLLAVSADDRRVLEREGIGRLDEGRVMAGRLEADGIRGRFSGETADRGWAMDLGVRVQEARAGA